jgi:hypothetical protein
MSIVCERRRTRTTAGGLVARRGGELTVLAFALIAAVGAGPAPDERLEDLRQAPSARQVPAVEYCRGRYDVKLGDGSRRPFKERDLRSGTASGARGPGAGHGVLVPTGRVGDRALVIFSEPDDIRSFVRKAC